MDLREMDFRENGYNGLYGNGLMGKWTYGEMDLRENGLHGLLGNGLKGKWT